jgi:hypothetical protein
MLVMTALLPALFVGHAVFAADQKIAAPYAGQQARTLKSLSPEDIQALRAGQGWGFAKPAELNGYPGPLHVLELRRDLGLSGDQETRIQEIFAKMQQAAKKAGADYLAAEMALEEAFAKNTAMPGKIAELTLASAKSRGELQLVHLHAHLLTAPLLSEAQRHRYNVLRGYAGEHGAHHGGMQHGGAGHNKGSHSGR